MQRTELTQANTIKSVATSVDTCVIYTAESGDMRFYTTKIYKGEVTMDMKDTREKLSMSFYDRFLLLMREIKDKRVLIVDSKSEKSIDINCVWN